MKCTDKYIQTAAELVSELSGRDRGRGCGSFKAGNWKKPNFAREEAYRIAKRLYSEGYTIQDLSKAIDIKNSICKGEY